MDRVTVHRWLREDFAFQAAWNRDRRELRRAAYNRLERPAAKAANGLEKAIDGGDVKAALEIVKGMGILAPSLIGSEDASELASEAAVETLEPQGNLKTRTMLARSVEIGDIGGLVPADGRNSPIGASKSPRSPDYTVRRRASRCARTRL